MSSYLNKQAPPPPPPKSTNTSSSSSSSPLPQDDTSSSTPRSKPSHRHKQSIHYNDAPDLASLAAEGGSGSLKRDRSTRTNTARVSRVPALQSIPASTTNSSTGTSTPLNRDLPVEAPDLTLPAFNVPPPPPPLPVSTIRTGPRLLPFDVLHYPPPSLTVKLVLVFIPGNPGLVDYYRSFLSTLQSSLPPSIRDSTELYAVGHLGHSLQSEEEGLTRGFKPNDQATLEEQVESKVEFIDELRGKHGDDVQIMVMGHSIGSWVCLQIMNRRPDAVTSAHLLFPTISSMSTTPNGRRLSPLFSSWTLRPLFLSTSFLSYLPKSLISTLVSILTGHSGPGSEVTNRLVKAPQTVIAAVTMAAKEMQQVTSLDRELIDRFKSRLWWYWAEDGNDGWVLEESIKEIEEVLGEGEKAKERRERCQEGMPHAFVLNEEHTTSLAKRCAGWIVTDLEATANDKH